MPKDEFMIAVLLERSLLLASKIAACSRNETRSAAIVSIPRVFFSAIDSKNCCLQLCPSFELGWLELNRQQHAFSDTPIKQSFVYAMNKRVKLLGVKIQIMYKRV